MKAQPHIDAYSFGQIEIDGQPYTSDVIILPEKVKSAWLRDKGHKCRFKDLAAVFEAEPQVLVIGQGADGFMKITDKAMKSLKKAGIETVCEKTGDAVDVYNQRVEKGEKVAAALHLTC